MGKKCQKCGNELGDTAKFCSKCGSKYEEVIYEKPNENKCLECGSTVRKEDKFCPKCGKSVAMQNEETEISEKGKEKFVCDVKNFKTSSKKRKRKIALTICGGIFAMFFVFALFGSEDLEYVDAETFKQTFCENIGVEYNSENWNEISNDTTSYISQGYFNGDSLIAIIYINDEDKVVGACINSALTIFSDIDEEFLWKCALVSAITGYDLNECDSIVREVNKNEQTTQITDEIFINPYQEIEEGWATFIIKTKKFDGN